MKEFVQGRLSSYEAMLDDSTYPKSARLRRKAEFTRVFSQGDVFPGRQALVRRAPNCLGHARLGLSVPRRYGKAVRRNTFRRLAREAFRAVKNRLGAHEYVLSPRRHLETPTLAGLTEDLLRTLVAAPAPRRDRGGRPRGT